MNIKVFAMISMIVGEESEVAGLQYWVMDDLGLFWACVFHAYLRRPQMLTYRATPGIGDLRPVVFDQNQISNYTVGSGYELRMYVNGQQSTDFGSLVLQSHMIIVVAYRNSATNWAQYLQLSGEQWPYPNL
jgi:hypothetical protein